MERFGVDCILSLWLLAVGPTVVLDRSAGDKSGGGPGHNRSSPSMSVTNTDLHSLFGPCACILSSGNLFGEITLMQPVESSARTATIITREVSPALLACRRLGW